MGAVVLQPSPTISAVQINYTSDGTETLGLFTQIPRGSGISVCGEGFNERTVKVQFRGTMYFVFREDLDEPKPN